MPGTIENSSWQTFVLKELSGNSNSGGISVTVQRGCNWHSWTRLLRPPYKSNKASLKRVVLSQEFILRWNMMGKVSEKRGMVCHQGLYYAKNPFVTRKLTGLISSTSLFLCASTASVTRMSASSTTSRCSGIKHRQNHGHCQRSDGKAMGLGLVIS